MGWRYRAVQFLRTLRDKPSAADRQFAHNHLPPSMRPLFDRMSPADQSHSIRVCRSLLDQGHTDPDLLTAALLHDVGKSVQSPGVWERVLIVLANQIAPGQVLKWSAAEPRGWKRAFVIAHKHPEWGADLVAEHGGSPTTVRLIRQHQQRPDSGQAGGFELQLALLQAADSGN